jgi:hypothetical protein
VVKGWGFCAVVLKLVLCFSQGREKSDGRIKTLKSKSSKRTAASFLEQSTPFSLDAQQKYQKESSFLSSQHYKDVAILGRDKGWWKMAADFYLPKLTSLRNASLRSSTLPRRLYITATSH